MSVFKNFISASVFWSIGLVAMWLILEGEKYAFAISIGCCLGIFLLGYSHNFKKKKKGGPMKDEP